jgi:hypothetical protein
MPSAGDTLKEFYAAAKKKDIPEARRYLKDDLLFLGLFETYHNAEEYMAALTKLLQVVVRLDVKTIIAEGNQPPSSSSWRPGLPQPPRPWSRNGTR